MRFAIFAAVAVAATLLVSCSREVPEPEHVPASTSPSSAHGALASCLSEHGVPAAPGPAAGPPPGVDQATWDDAMHACSTLGPGPAG